MTENYEIVNLKMKTIETSTLTALPTTDYVVTNQTHYVHLTVPFTNLSYKTYYKVVLRIKQVTSFNYPLVVKETTDNYLIKSGTTLNAEYVQINNESYRLIDVTELVNKNKSTTLYLGIIQEEGREIRFYSDTSTNKPEVDVEVINDYDFYKKQVVLNEIIGEHSNIFFNTRNGKPGYYYTFNESLFLKYNISYANSISVKGKDTNLPKGFKLNYQEYVIENTNDITYIDDEFLTHTFKQVDGNANLYYETDRNYLTLKKEYLNDILDKYVISDNIGTKKEFNKNGYLTRIISSNNLITNITYDSSNKLTKVEFFDGFKFTFNYETNKITINYIPRTNENIRTYTINYSDNYLTSIKDNMNSVTSYSYKEITNSLIILALKPTTKKYLNKIETGNYKIDVTYDDSLRVKEIVKKYNYQTVSKYTLEISGVTSLVSITKENKTKKYVYTYNENQELYYSYELLTLNGKPNTTHNLVYEESNRGMTFVYQDTLKKLINTTELTNYETEDHQIVLENKTLEYDEIRENTYVVLALKVKINNEVVDSTLDKEVKVKLYEDNNVFKEVKTLNPTNQNYQFVCFLYKLPKQTERLINLHLKISSRYKVKIYDYELIDKIENCEKYFVSGDEKTISLNDDYKMSYCKYEEIIYFDGFITKEDIIQNIYNLHINYKTGTRDFWYNDGKSYLPGVMSIIIETTKQNYVTITHEMKLDKVIETKGMKLTKTIEYNQKTDDDDSLNNDVYKLKETTTTYYSVYNITKINKKYYNKRGCLVRTETSDPTYIKGETYTLNNLDQVVIKRLLTKDNKTLQVESNLIDENGLINESKQYIEDSFETYSYTYDEYNNLLSTTNSENEVINHYSYDNNDELKIVHNLTETQNHENEQKCNVLSYDEVTKQITKVEANNIIYNFDYDEFERVTTITKENNTNQILDTYQFEYNDLYGTTIIKHNDIEISNVETDDLERIIKQDDINFIYEDDAIGRLKELRSNNYKMKYAYRNDEIISEELTNSDDETLYEIRRTSGVAPIDNKTYNINESTFYVGNQYFLDKVKKTITLSDDYGDEISTSLVYPKLKITDITSFQVEEVVKPYDGTKKQVNASLSYVTDNSPLPRITTYNTTHKYTYYTNNNKTLTNFLREETYEAYGLNNRTKTTSMAAYQYTRTGLIKKITNEISGFTAYTYDPSFRLTKERTESVNSLIKEINYTYDESNNILSKIINNGTTTKTINYTYDPNDKDKLLKYDNQPITYDILGRVIKYYKDNKEYNIEYYKQSLIKKITIYQNETLEKVIEYSYDPLGNLIKEEVYEGTSSLTLVRTYNFYYDGQKLIREVLTEGNEENVIDYIYAESGLIGIRENYQIYQCYQNALKDIVAIYDKGTKVCTYNYTAYGETTIKNEERNGIPLSRIGERSSIRYRGYQIDKETGLYLLKTRCYNSEWGRFITKDTIDYLEPDKVYGLNLYAYCMNNPVNYFDGSGHSPDSIWKTLLGIAVGVGLAVVTVAAVVASGGTLLVPVLVGAGVGAGLNLVGQGVSNLSQGKGFFEDINWGNVALGGLSGAAFATGVGGLWGAVAIGATSNAGMSALEGNSWANIGFSALVGGASAFVGFKLGKFVSNKLLNINTNLGIGDYVNMARVDGAGFLSRSVVALMSKLYTMGPTIVTGVGRGVTKFVGNYIGDWF